MMRSLSPVLQEEVMLEQPSGLRLAFQRIVLFENFRIRDTAVKFPQISLDLRGADYWAFEILNELNQSVTVELIGGDSRSPASLGLIGLSATISATTNEPIVSDVWVPFMSARLSCSSLPTAGQVTVYGFVRKWVRG